MLIDLRPRLVKPSFRSVEVDWGHPLTNDLKLGWVMNEGGGSSAYNIVSKDDQKGTLSGVTSWVTKQAGLGLNFTASISDYVQNAAVRNYAVATVAIRVQLVDISPLTATRIGGFQNGPGSTTDDKELGLISTNVFQWHIYDGAAKDVNGTTVVSAGKLYDVCGTADGTTSRLYVNGAQEGSVAAGNTFTGYTANDIILNSSNNNYPTAGAKIIFFTYVWNRALTAGEVLWLHAEPYAFLRPVIRRHWFVPPAAGPAGRGLFRPAEPLTGAGVGGGFFKDPLQ